MKEKFSDEQLHIIRSALVLAYFHADTNRQWVAQHLPATIRRFSPAMLWATDDVVSKVESMDQSERVGLLREMELYRDP